VRLDLVAIGSRVWLADATVMELAEKAGVHCVEDELTQSGCSGRSGAPPHGYL
jgi:hypothetical protein